VILYAGNFVPSWAGAIAIDLLPAVLVFILMVVQSSIRSGRDPVALAERLTLAEMRAAVSALREIEAEDRTPDPAHSPGRGGATARIETLEIRKAREAPGP
jgi:hypothetical protein